MDQSTQVNFPTTMRLLRKRLQRHSTATDVRSSIRRLKKSSPWMNNDSLPSAIPQLKLSAQRALNITTEALQRSNLNDNPPCSPNSRNSHTPSAELPLSVISQGQTSPQSSSSSIITSNCSQQPNYLLQSPHKLYSSHTGSNSQHFFQVPLVTYHNETNNSCKCFNKYNIGGKPSATPEGLSWRRLHMSRAKLKATSTTSELLSGFAMVAMVELQINEDTAVPEWLFVMFSICTTVLVAVHIFALMISTYILPNIDAISKLDVCELVTESPHERMKGFIELAWAFSTVLGLFLFLVEVAILCWVKFWDYSFTAAIAATVIVIPVLVIFVLFAVHFYHSLVVHKCDSTVSDMQRLEDMKKHLDEATSPA